MSAAAALRPLLRYYVCVIADPLEADIIDGVSRPRRLALKAAFEIWRSSFRLRLRPCYVTAALAAAAMVASSKVTTIATVVQ